MPKEPRSTAAIAGGAGYVGAELTRLLLLHPTVELVGISSRSQAGRPVDQVYPHFRGWTDLTFTDRSAAELSKDVDVLFLALPHGRSMDVVGELLEGLPDAGRARVIDMSGDFRLDDPDSYEIYYGKSHSCPHLLDRFQYGLSEWNRDSLRSARLVANPGCFATAIGLALAPLAAAALLPERVTVFGVTGSTGSGALSSPNTHHPTRATNFKLYKVLKHQHVPEIEAQLRRLGGSTRISLVPASAPMTHGIYAAAHVPCDRPGELAAIVRRAYEGEGFVRVLETAPQQNWVIGSNNADVGLFPGDNELVIACAIDNMIKGAAGQAVQNMNLMLGEAEDAGLRGVASLP